MSDENKEPENKEPEAKEQEKLAAPAPARAQVIFLKGRSSELEALRRSLVMDSRNEVQESSAGWAPQLAKKKMPCIVIAEARDEAESIKVLTLCKSLVNEIRAKKVKVAVVSKLEGRAFSKQLEFYGHVEYIRAPIAEKALEFKVTVLTKALQVELEKEFEKEQRRQALRAAPKAAEPEAEGEKKPNLQIVRGSTAPDVSTEFVRVGRPKNNEEPKKPLGHLMDLAMKFEKEEPAGKSTVKTEHFLNPKWRQHDLSPQQAVEYRRKLSGPDEMTQWRNRITAEKQQDAKRAPGELMGMAAQGTPPKAALVQNETPRAKRDTSGETRQPKTSTDAPNPFSPKPVAPVREWKVRARSTQGTPQGTPPKAANVESETPQVKHDESNQSQKTKQEERPSATLAQKDSSIAPTPTQAFHKTAQQERGRSSEAARQEPARQEKQAKSERERAQDTQHTQAASVPATSTTTTTTAPALSLISLAVQWSDSLYASGPSPEEGDAVGAVLRKFCEMLRFACNADGVAVLKADTKGTCSLLAEAAGGGSTFGVLDSVHVESAERAIGEGLPSYEEIEGSPGMIEAYFPLKDVSGVVVVRLARTNPFFKQMDQLASAASLVRGVLGGFGSRAAAA
ncbi:MAG: hypothetical protein HYW49_13810 [Deltaproteobacteria bacterium]|nr:hypothetical protein [Deltaproteobacteria bacterium]